MTSRHTPVAALAAALSLLAVAPAVAQIKPMHSGHMSHGAAQMRADGSGLHHPNRPDHHHHYGYAGYRHPGHGHMGHQGERPPI